MIPTTKACPPIPFASPKTKVLNLRRRWPLIQPLVQMPRIQKLLARCLRHWMRVRKEIFLVRHPELRQLHIDGWFRYDPKLPPYAHGTGNAWWSRPLPRVDSIEWFQVEQACHYLVDWAVEVASVHMPRLSWEIRRSSLHSTVVGCESSGEIRWIFDILWFEELTVDEIMVWTRNVDPVAPKLQKPRRPGRRGILS
jgi:hypothetical protein